MYQIGDWVVYGIHGVCHIIGEEKQLVTWDLFTKATASRKSILLYTSKVNAFIFPRRILGEDINTLVQIISLNMPASKVKIRGSI